MLNVENRTEIKRVPQQKRSQDRFERVLQASLRLFAARGYESVSMREIAREAQMPIATVYQYFPMKLAIVREIWSRYTSEITGALTEGIRLSVENGTDQSQELIGSIVDRMAQLQAANPAFIEIWSCVAASLELRALNVEDSLHNARLIADYLQKLHPRTDARWLHDRALITVETASSTTRLALGLPEPHRARVLHSLKAVIAQIVDPDWMVKSSRSLSPASGKQSEGNAANGTVSRKAATASSDPSVR
jgi:AcrR family transcriptional regulator